MDARSTVPRESLRYGFLAHELPPERGGMQEHARNLIGSFGSDAVVFTSAGRTMAGVELHANMTWDCRTDLPELEASAIDIWISLNAGLAHYATRLRAPLVAIVHGSDFLAPWLPAEPALYGRVARHVPLLRIGSSARRERLVARGLRDCAGLITVSDASRRALCGRYAVRPGDVDVVAPGIDPSCFRERPPRPGDSVRLLTIARLSVRARRKNVEGVLRALSLVDPAVAWSYTVVGDGDDRRSLERLAGELGLARRVRFVGEVDDARLRTEIDRHDLLVLVVRPHETDFEGFGMVYVEAAACGMPSLASGAGGSGEAVIDGVNGFVLHDSQPAAIARGIERFARERDRFDPEAVRETARAYEAASIGARVRAIVDGALARAPQRPDRRSGG